MRFHTFSRFITALVCAGVLLALPLAATIGFIAPARTDSGIYRAEAPVDNLYKPDRGDSLAILFAGLRQDGSLNCFALIHADPMKQALSVVMLPRDFMADSDGGLLPMDAIWAKGDAQAAAAALSATAGIYIHRSATVPAEAFGKIADAAGTVEMLLPIAIDITEAGTRIEAGRQRMNSTRLIAMMEQGNFPGGEAQRLGLVGDAVLKIAEKYLSGFGSTVGERLFLAFVNTLPGGNISMADYEYRRPAFEALHAQGNVTATATVAGWTDTEAGRLLTADAIAALQEVCYPIEGW